MNSFLPKKTWHESDDKQKLMRKLEESNGLVFFDSNGAPAGKKKYSGIAWKKGGPAAAGMNYQCTLLLEAPL